ERCDAAFGRCERLGERLDLEVERGDLALRGEPLAGGRVDLGARRGERRAALRGSCTRHGCEPERDDARARDRADAGGRAGQSDDTTGPRAALLRHTSAAPVTTNSGPGHWG